jgi:pyrroline-5-carboxylate reductase
MSAETGQARGLEGTGQGLLSGPRRWGFIGAGKMATAIIQGMLRGGTAADSISASDPIPHARVSLLNATGIRTFDANEEVVKNSDVVVLAVKPQMMSSVLDELKHSITADHLIVSVAAGVSLSTLARGLGADRRIARAMPNTPALVGEGASAYCLGPATLPGDDAIVAACLEAIGLSFRVPESQLDAVTGLSGSGPAFVYVIIEALADGGVRAGLPRELALSLAAQTVLGSARMVLETGQHPGFLKDQVTSPAGTTIAGLHALERGGIRAALMDAVEASWQRSVELAAMAAQAEKS